MTLDTAQLESSWRTVAPVLMMSTEAQYHQAQETLDTLLTLVGDQPDHPLADFLDTLGTLMHAYEEKHLPVPAASGREVLRYLMEEHGLRQSELPEVGSQGVVSEILNGKRELNLRQIRALAARFHVAPATFL